MRPHARQGGGEGVRRRPARRSEAPGGAGLLGPSSVRNASPGRSASEGTATSAAAVSPGPTPTHFMPPRRAASIPAAASSTTTHCSGGTPSRAAAARKTSGSGLPRCTSSAATKVSMSPSKRRAARIASTFARGADEAMACRQPASWRARTAIRNEPKRGLRHKNVSLTMRPFRNGQ